MSSTNSFYPAIFSLPHTDHAAILCGTRRHPQLVLHC